MLDMPGPADRSRGFHEWPLVVFTTLAILGAGLLATPIFAAIEAGTPAPAAAAIPWGALLLGAGIAVSLSHLGQPQRALLAARGLGRSPLSAEIVVAGVTLVMAVTTAILHYVSPLLDILTAISGLAVLVSLGLVYRLPGQPTWRGAVVWMPLSSGLGFGAVALAGIWGSSLPAVGAVAAVVLAADTGLLVARRMALTWPRVPLAPRYPSFFAQRQAWLAARFALVDIVPGVLLFFGLPKGAAGILCLGILIDRLSFYGLAAQHTTEAEIGRVEGAIAALGG